MVVAACEGWWSQEAGKKKEDMQKAHAELWSKHEALQKVWVEQEVGMEVLKDEKQKLLNQVKATEQNRPH